MIYSCYLIKYFLDQSIQKNIYLILKTEALGGDQTNVLATTNSLINNVRQYTHTPLELCSPRVESQKHPESETFSHTTTVFVVTDTSVRSATPKTVRFHFINIKNKNMY